jgi:hypothetical protein
MVTKMLEEGKKFNTLKLELELSQLNVEKEQIALKQSQVDLQKNLLDLERDKFNFEKKYTQKKIYPKGQIESHANERHMIQDKRQYKLDKMALDMQDWKAWYLNGSNLASLIASDMAQEKDAYEEVNSMYDDYDSSVCMKSGCHFFYEGYPEIIIIIIEFYCLTPAALPVETRSTQRALPKIGRARKGFSHLAWGLQVAGQATLCGTEKSGPGADLRRGRGRPRTLGLRRVKRSWGRAGRAGMGTAQEAGTRSGQWTCREEELGPVAVRVREGEEEGRREAVRVGKPRVVERGCGEVWSGPVGREPA